MGFAPTGNRRSFHGALNSEGYPDFHAVIVECAEWQYNNGEHYDAAKNHADENRYERPMLAFDENDGQSRLMEMFEWDDAETVKLEVDPGE